MGTWNTSINGNDIFLDIYSSFFERYNQGDTPEDISKRILDDFKDEFEDMDEKTTVYLDLH